jgi:hypothetical protein
METMIAEKRKGDFEIFFINNLVEHANEKDATDMLQQVLCS